MKSSYQQGILILSGYNPRGVLAFLRVCRKYDIPTYIIANGEEDFIFQTDYKKNVVHIRRDKCIQNLYDIVSKIKQNITIDRLYFIPSTEYLNRYLIEHIEELNTIGVEVPLVDAKLYRMISDKESFKKLCIKYLLEVPEEIEEDHLTFPSIFKPKSYESFMGKPVKVNGIEEYQTFVNTNEKEKWQLEKYIEGESYYLLYYFKKNGQYISFSQENLIQQDHGKSIILAKPSTIHTLSIAEHYACMFKNEGFTGIVMVEIRKNQGKYFMIEANPRLWGPSQLVVDSQVPIFEEYLKDMGFDIKYRECINMDAMYFWEEGLIQSEGNEKYYSYTREQLREDYLILLNWEIYNRSDIRK